RQLQSVDFYGVHESFNQFKQYFFVNASRNPQYERLVLRGDRHDELLDLVKQYSLYVDKEGVLTTPGRDFIIVDINLPEALKNNYNELKQTLAVELGEDITITSPSTAAALNKLNQVTSGFIIDTLAVKHNRMIQKLKKAGEFIP